MAILPHKKTGTNISLRVQGTVRLLHFEKGKVTTINNDQSNLDLIERLMAFDLNKYVAAMCKEDGFYFIDHATRQCNYLGPTMQHVILGLRVRGLTSD